MAIWLLAREEFADNRFQLLFIYILALTPAFGGHLCYGASSTAFRRKCSDDSVISKALLMSAMLMTESWATEVRSYPWPQYVKVVPQDKQHSWHTLHSKELAVAFSFEM